jgi:AGCS family alanine or glycine:cation symporter
MAFPNLIALLALSGVVYAMHKRNGDPDAGHPVHDYREEPRHPEQE